LFSQYQSSPIGQYWKIPGTAGQVVPGILLQL
jgi:hypothetical protein